MIPSCIPITLQYYTSVTQQCYFIMVNSMFSFNSTFISIVIFRLYKNCCIFSKKYGIVVVELYGTAINILPQVPPILFNLYNVFVIDYKIDTY